MAKRGRKRSIFSGLQKTVSIPLKSWPKHKKVRRSCKSCGRVHSSAEHRFHGKGAYKRTH